MDILPSCALCGNSFVPRDRLGRRNPNQKYCLSCIEQSHTCVDCGAVKHRSVRGPRCKKCNDLASSGKPNLKNRREAKPIEQIIAEVEAIGLRPEKRYAFGYVMGVVFGDGSVFKDVHRNLKRRDGARRDRPVTLYCVKLQVTSQTFAERFAQQWEVLTGRHATVYASVRTNFEKSTLKGYNPEGYRMQLFSVEPRHALFGPYLMHRKYEAPSSDLLRFPLIVMAGFIHGMIDSEGYVCPAYTDIANTNVDLLNTLVSMFAKFGQRANVYTSPSQHVAHLRIGTLYYKYDIPIEY